MTPPKLTLRDVPAQVQAAIGADPEKSLTSPMLAAFATLTTATAASSTLSDADRTNLTKRAADAYRCEQRIGHESQPVG